MELLMGAEDPYLGLPETSSRETIKVKFLFGGLNGGKSAELLT